MASTDKRMPDLILRGGIRPRRPPRIEPLICFAARLGIVWICSRQTDLAVVDH